MDHLVVGNDGCTFGQIAIEIGHNLIPLSDSDLTQLMRHLRTTPQMRDWVTCRDKNRVSIQDCIEAILTDWRKRKSNEATLHTFIEILRTMEQNTIADALETELRSNTSNGRQSSPETTGTPTVVFASVSQLGKQSTCSIIDNQSTRINICTSSNADTSNDPDESEMGQATSLNNKQGTFFYSNRKCNGYNLVGESQDGRKAIPLPYAIGFLVFFLCILVTVVTYVIVFHKGQNIGEADRSSEIVTQMNIFGLSNEQKHSNSTELNYDDDELAKGLSFKTYAGSPELRSLDTTPSTFFRSQNHAMNELVVNTSEKLEELFYFQNNLKNLNILKFDYHKGPKCSESIQHNFTENIYLPNAKHLTLNISTSCGILVDVILNKISMTHLRVFNFIGKMNDENIQQIHQFFVRYHQSLNEIYITGGLESGINLFEIRNSFVLNSVTQININLDNFSYQTNNWEIINDRFCSLFPGLTRFRTRYLSISLDEFFKLQKCFHIRFINATVKIRENEIRRIENLKWQTLFPSLKNITAKFDFEVCPSKAVAEVFRNNSQTLDGYHFCSNCIISPERDMKCIQKL